MPVPLSSPIPFRSYNQQLSYEIAHNRINTLIPRVGGYIFKRKPRRAKTHPLISQIKKIKKFLTGK